MIKVTNLAEFDAEVQRWFNAFEKAAAEAAVGLAKAAFKQILETSPQYSGDFVANWKVQINGVTPSFTSNAVGGLDREVPFQVGDRPAINKALSNAKWPRIKLGDSIYLHNTAFHDSYYAWKIENNQINFRPVNEDAHHVVTRALYATAFMNDRLTPQRLAILRGIA